MHSTRDDNRKFDFIVIVNNRKVSGLRFAHRKYVVRPIMMIMYRSRLIQDTHLKSIMGFVFFNGVFIDFVCSFIMEFKMNMVLYTV